MIHQKSAEVKSLQAKTVAAVRHVGPYQGDTALFERLYEKLMAWAGPQGLLAVPDTQFLNIYYDNPRECPPEKLRMDVGLTIHPGVDVAGDVEKRDIPGGEYAVATYQLDADEFPEAWADAIQGVMEQGLALDDRPSFEVCLNNPAEHPENKHLVEIVIPVCRT